MTRNIEGEYWTVNASICDNKTKADKHCDSTKKSFTSLAQAPKKAKSRKVNLYTYGTK